MIFRILFLTALILLIDYYVFQGIKFTFRTNSESAQKVVKLVYWSLTAICLSILISFSLYGFGSLPKFFRTYASAFVFVVMISKLLIVIFLFTDDIGRGIRWVYEKISGSSNNGSVAALSTNNSISRSDFIVKTGLLVSMVPFVSLIYGMVKGAYDYQVKNVKIKLPNLPDAFHGFRIIQISDIHTGSFVTTDPLHEAVRLINEQKADMILFTGDLVNNRSDELIPHKEVLSKLKAPHGVYSILGNHDYGDYVVWESEKAKRDNLQTLINSHREMGWDILLDEHREIEKNGEKISLIGVQNWSTHMRFPKYGSLKKATENIEYNSFNILMSHDPSHWHGEVLKDFPKVDLMLAGHTHGMQFGVELPFMKWSPVQYIYKEWAGLYEKGHQKLYVNRGLGFLGYPGRVGILPEITVLELHKV